MQNDCTVTPGVAQMRRAEQHARDAHSGRGAEPVAQRRRAGSPGYHLFAERRGEEKDGEREGGGERRAVGSRADAQPSRGEQHAAREPDRQRRRAATPRASTRGRTARRSSPHVAPRSHVDRAKHDRRARRLRNELQGDLRAASTIANRPAACRRACRRRTRSRPAATITSSRNATASAIVRPSVLACVGRRDSRGQELVPLRRRGQCRRHDGLHEIEPRRTGARRAPTARLRLPVMIESCDRPPTYRHEDARDRRDEPRAEQRRRPRAKPSGDARRDRIREEVATRRPEEPRDPGGPIGANTGTPAAPATRYSTMLAAPSTGPSSKPGQHDDERLQRERHRRARNRNGDLRRERERAAKPTIADAERRGCRASGRREPCVVMSVPSRDAERHRVAAAEAERREAGARVRDPSSRTTASSARARRSRRSDGRARSRRRSR